MAKFHPSLKTGKNRAGRNILIRQRQNGNTARVRITAEKTYSLRSLLNEGGQRFRVSVFSVHLLSVSVQGSGGRQRCGFGGLTETIRTEKRVAMSRSSKQP